VQSEHLMALDRQAGVPAWQAFFHPRFSHAQVEHCLYLDGPSRSDALAGAADAALAFLEDLQESTQHLVRAVQVRNSEVSMVRV